MKETIAIDIDEVLSESNAYFLPLFKQEYWIDIRYEEITHHSFCMLPGITIGADEFLKAYKRFLSYPEALHCDPVAGSLEALHELKKQYRLVALTARNVETRSLTEQWINLNFPWVFDLVSLVGNDAGLSLTKWEYCVQQGVVLLVDDCFEYIWDAAERWVKWVLLTKPWNKDRLADHPLIQRAHTWADIPGLIQLLLWKSS